MFVSSEHLKKIDARLDSFELSRSIQRDGLVNLNTRLVGHLKEHKEREESLKINNPEKALEARPATRRIDEMVLKTLRQTKAANRELKEQVKELEGQVDEQARIINVCRQDHQTILGLSLQLNILEPHARDLEVYLKVAVEALKKEREKTHEQGKTISKMTLEIDRLKKEINEATFCGFNRDCPLKQKRYRP